MEYPKLFLLLILGLNLTEGRQIALVPRAPSQKQYQIISPISYYSITPIQWLSPHEDHISDYYYDDLNDELPQRPSREYVPPLSPDLIDNNDVILDNVNSAPLQDYYYGGDYEHDYDEDDDDDDDDDHEKKKAPLIKKKKKYDLYEKFDMKLDKIHNKILDKFLHIKEKKPPKAPEWAEELIEPAPEIELPPWGKWG